MHKKEDASLFSTHTNHPPTLKMLDETETSQKNIQQCKTLISLLAEIRLKENERTQRTSVRIKFYVILIVPMCVTEAYLSFRNRTDFDTIEVIDIRQDIEQTT
jgi:hypothetical protein